MSSKIDKFSQDSIKKLRKVIETNISKEMDKYGLKVKLGNITYRAQEFHTKISITAGGKTIEVLDFEKYASRFGLKSSDLNKVFTSFSGESYEICGMKTRSRKYPILAKDIKTGKVYKFSEQQIIHYLKDADNEKLTQEG